MIARRTSDCYQCSMFCHFIDFHLFYDDGYKLFRRLYRKRRLILLFYKNSILG